MFPKPWIFSSLSIIRINEKSFPFDLLHYVKHSAVVPPFLGRVLEPISSFLESSRNQDPTVS